MAGRRKRDDRYNIQPGLGYATDKTGRPMYDEEGIPVKRIEKVDILDVLNWSYEYDEFAESLARTNFVERQKKKAGEGVLYSDLKSSLQYVLDIVNKLRLDTPNRKIIYSKGSFFGYEPKDVLFDLRLISQSNGKTSVFDLGTIGLSKFTNNYTSFLSQLASALGFSSYTEIFGDIESNKLIPRLDDIYSFLGIKDKETKDQLAKFLSSAENVKIQVSRPYVKTQSLVVSPENIDKIKFSTSYKQLLSALQKGVEESSGSNAERELVKDIRSVAEGISYNLEDEASRKALIKDLAMYQFRKQFGPTATEEEFEKTVAGYLNRSVAGRTLGKILFGPEFVIDESAKEMFPHFYLGVQSVGGFERFINASRQLLTSQGTSLDKIDEMLQETLQTSIESVLTTVEAGLPEGVFENYEELSQTFLQESGKRTRRRLNEVLGRGSKLSPDSAQIFSILSQNYPHILDKDINPDDVQQVLRKAGYSFDSKKVEQFVKEVRALRAFENAFSLHAAPEEESYKALINRLSKGTADLSEEVDEKIIKHVSDLNYLGSIQSIAKDQALSTLITSSVVTPEYVEAKNAYTERVKRIANVLEENRGDIKGKIRSAFVNLITDSDMSFNEIKHRYLSPLVDIQRDLIHVQRLYALNFVNPELLESKYVKRILTNEFVQEIILEEDIKDRLKDKSIFRDSGRVKDLINILRQKGIFDKAKEFIDNFGITGNKSIDEIGTLFKSFNELKVASEILYIPELKNVVKKNIKSIESVIKEIDRDKLISALTSPQIIELKKTGTDRFGLIVNGKPVSGELGFQTLIELLKNAGVSDFRVKLKGSDVYANVLLSSEGIPYVLLQHGTSEVKVPITKETPGIWYLSSNDIASGNAYVNVLKDRLPYIPGATVALEEKGKIITAGVFDVNLAPASTAPTSSIVRYTTSELSRLSGSLFTYLPARETLYGTAVLLKQLEKGPVNVLAFDLETSTLPESIDILRAYLPEINDKELKDLYKVLTISTYSNTLQRVSGKIDFDNVKAVARDYILSWPTQQFANERKMFANALKSIEEEYRSFGTVALTPEKKAVINMAFNYAKFAPFYSALRDIERRSKKDSALEKTLSYLKTPEGKPYLLQVLLGLNPEISIKIEQFASVIDTISQSEYLTTPEQVSAVIDLLKSTSAGMRLFTRKEYAFSNPYEILLSEIKNADILVNQNIGFDINQLLSSDKELDGLRKFDTELREQFVSELASKPKIDILHLGKVFDIGGGRDSSLQLHSIYEKILALDNEKDVVSNLWHIGSYDVTVVGDVLRRFANRINSVKIESLDLNKGNTSFLVLSPKTQHQLTGIYDLENIRDNKNILILKRRGTGEILSIGLYNLSDFDLRIGYDIIPLLSSEDEIYAHGIITDEINKYLKAYISYSPDITRGRFFVEQFKDLDHVKEAVKLRNTAVLYEEVTKHYFDTLKKYGIRITPSTEGYRQAVEGLIRTIEQLSPNVDRNVLKYRLPDEFKKRNIDYSFIYTDYFERVENALRDKRNQILKSWLESKGIHVDQLTSRLSDFSIAKFISFNENKNMVVDTQQFLESLSRSLGITVTASEDEINRVVSTIVNELSTETKEKMSEFLDTFISNYSWFYNPDVVGSTMIQNTLWENIQRALSTAVKGEAFVTDTLKPVALRTVYEALPSNAKTYRRDLMTDIISYIAENYKSFPSVPILDLTRAENINFDVFYQYLKDIISKNEEEIKNALLKIPTFTGDAEATAKGLSRAVEELLKNFDVEQTRIRRNRGVIRRYVERNLGTIERIVAESFPKEFVERREILQKAREIRKSLYKDRQEYLNIKSFEEIHSHIHDYYKGLQDLAGIYEKIATEVVPRFESFDMKFKGYNVLSSMMKYIEENYGKELSEVLSSLYSTRHKIYMQMFKSIKDVPKDVSISPHILSHLVLIRRPDGYDIRFSAETFHAEKAMVQEQLRIAEKRVREAIKKGESGIIVSTYEKGRRDLEKLFGEYVEAEKIFSKIPRLQAREYHAIVNLVPDLNPFEILRHTSTAWQVKFEVPKSLLEFLSTLHGKEIRELTVSDVKDLLYLSSAMTRKLKTYSGLPEMQRILIDIMNKQAEDVPLIKSTQDLVDIVLNKYIDVYGNRVFTRLSEVAIGNRGKVYRFENIQKIIKDGVEKEVKTLSIAMNEKILKMATIKGKSVHMLSDAFRLYDKEGRRRGGYIRFSEVLRTDIKNREMLYALDKILSNPTLSFIGSPEFKYFTLLRHRYNIYRPSRQVQITDRSSKEFKKVSVDIKGVYRSKSERLSKQILNSMNENIYQKATTKSASKKSIYTLIEGITNSIREKPFLWAGGALSALAGLIAIRTISRKKQYQSDIVYDPSGGVSGQVPDYVFPDQNTVYVEADNKPIGYNVSVEAYGSNINTEKLKEQITKVYKTRGESGQVIIRIYDNRTRLNKIEIQKRIDEHKRHFKK